MQRTDVRIKLVKIQLGCPLDVREASSQFQRVWVLTVQNLQRKQHDGGLFVCGLGFRQLNEGLQGHGLVVFAHQLVANLDQGAQNHGQALVRLHRQTCVPNAVHAVDDVGKLGCKPQLKQQRAAPLLQLRHAGDGQHKPFGFREL